MVEKRVLDEHGSYVSLDEWKGKHPTAESNPLAKPDVFEEPAKLEVSKDGLDNLDKDQLLDLCEQYEIKVKGNWGKPKLTKAIEEYLAGHEEEEAEAEEEL